MSSGSGGAGDLDPLDKELLEPVSVFAAELRVLFQGLETSVRRYAETHHMDGSTVSRYLSGRRIPQWAFVEQLLEDNAAARGGLGTDVLKHLKDLYEAALEAAKPNDTVHRLRDELALAVADLERARIHEEVLSEALHLRETRIRELQGRLALEQAQRSQDRINHEAELEARDTEITALRRQVADLKTELERVHSHTTGLERRATVVEETLALAEADTTTAAEDEITGAGGLEITGGSAVQRTVEQTQTLQRQLMAILEMVDAAHGAQTMTQLLGPAGPHMAALLERSAPVPDVDVDRLLELFQMALARQEQTTDKSHALSRMIARRPYNTARADLYASAFCLMLAAVYHGQNQHELQQEYLNRARRHFGNGYPHFMGKPSPTGSKYNYRTGSVSYVTDADKDRHAFSIRQVKELFDACQEQLRPPLRSDAPANVLD
ncbi:hypothetical protein ACGFYZ_33705 [Streptomyces sp. NPDC048330]|uniref:hypothetical protein n=1 Tax=Streptomyces sp. NPDC048330 TaxID=3365533 RepID=UPI00371EAD52